jgi:hypothetical protein
MVMLTFCIIEADVCTSKVSPASDLSSWSSGLRHTFVLIIISGSHQPTFPN